MFNLATNLESAAARHPDREAVVFRERRLTYREVEAEAGRVANGLAAAGVRAGDHVALVCPNRPEFIAAYFGVLKLGAVVVCVSALLRAREIAYQLEHGDVVAMIAYGGGDMAIGRAALEAFEKVEGCRRAWFIEPDAALGRRETWADLIAGRDGARLCAMTDFDDTAVVLYTSGTTGRPKGAELTHGNIVLNVVILARVKPADPDGGKWLIALPLFHIMAQTCSMHLCVFHAMTIVLMQRFDAAEAVRLMLKERIASFAGVPTMHRAILDCPDVSPEDAARLGDLLVSASSGGAPLPPDLRREFSERFDVPVTDGYGATETSPACCFHQSPEGVPPGSIGTAGWGVDLRVVDDNGDDVERGEVGELLVRGHCVMKGYYKNPEATAAAIVDGWYRTGDLARMDGDGYVFIAGRKKELIVRGGFNVYPAEVEAALMEHPDIAMAAVVGAPHPTHGEEVKAFVAPAPGATPAPGEIVAWSRERLAAHKYPRLVELRASLPLGQTGKVLKRALLERDADGETVR